MINLNEHLENIEQTIELRHKLFVDTKNKTTQGRLKIVDNNVFINLQNVLTVPGRFVTKEEQEANLALWVIIKDDTLVEDLWVLQKSYKLGYERAKIQFYILCFFLIIIAVFSIVWMIFKLLP